MCNFSTQKENYLICHVIRKHQHEKFFQVNCTAPSCFYSSKSWSGFRSHYSRKHRKSLNMSYVEESRNNADFFEESGLLTNVNEIHMQCANFALKLMSKHKLPESSVIDIIDSTINFLVFSEEITAQDRNINVSDALSTFKTGKTREAFCRRNCNYIPPQEVICGQSFIRKKDMLTCVNDCGYIIPFQNLWKITWINQKFGWRFAKTIQMKK